MTAPKLTAATVNRGTDDVVLTWTVDGDLEGSSVSSWMLSTTLVGGANGPIHELAFRWRDGKLEERWVFDHVTSTNHYTSNVNPQRVGQTWHAVFPVEAAVANSGTWKAALSFDEPKLSPNANTSTIDGTF